MRKDLTQYRMSSLGLLLALLAFVSFARAAEPIVLVAPVANAYVGQGETVTLNAQLNIRQSGALAHARVKIIRVDFRANGTLIASSTNRLWTATWIPSASGDFAITAEAVTRDGSIAYTSAPRPFSVLTVLYDKLGSTGNWGWTGQAAFNSFFDSISSQDNFAVSTQFTGTLPTTRTLRRIELAALYTSPGQNYDMANLTGCYIRVWNVNIADFHVSPVLPSLSSTQLGNFNLGNTSSSIGSIQIGGTTYFIYRVGWSGLNVQLPPNAQLELSVQCPVNTSAEQEFSVMGSSFPGPNLKSAIKAFGGPQTNFTIAQPLAVKLSVN